MLVIQPNITIDLTALTLGDQVPSALRALAPAIMGVNPIKSVLSNLMSEYIEYLKKVLREFGPSFS